jgi:glyoxylase-like metal-dependent hydrolase (beta-lactamase superfamily II)
MRQLCPDLWQTAAEHPFGPDVSTHAYLWRGPAGNVLFYNTGLPDALDAIAGLGGVACQYLSHRHEVAPSLAAVRARFAARLCCHALEAPAAQAVTPVHETFDAPHRPLPGLEVIPTPGHTAGSTCFRVQGAAGGYLFTGDSLFPDGDGWATYVSTDQRATLAASLERLRAPAPALVLASAARHPLGYRAVDATQWQRILDAAIADLR